MIFEVEPYYVVITKFLLDGNANRCLYFFWGEFVDYKSYTNAQLQSYNAHFVSREAYVNLLMVVDHL